MNRNWTTDTDVTGRAADGPLEHPHRAREGDEDQQTLPAFERTGDDLAEESFLLELIEHNLPPQEVT